MKLDTKRLTLLSSLVAVAMILSYIESLLPAFVAVPGVKVGLSNIATVFALYILGAPSAVCVSVVRVCLSALLFGNFASFLYSLGGALLALVCMILIKRVKVFSTVGVSTVGAVMHNAGQVAVACVVMENAAISLYIVPLVISGTVAGAVIGVVSGILCEKLSKRLKL
ncbi:MAG: Gx transporter family protein [Clostridia bacterium]|nr:Gx transporter family protein [Clostridia bacterium]